MGGTTDTRDKMPAGTAFDEILLFYPSFIPTHRRGSVKFVLSHCNLFIVKMCYSLLTCRHYMLPQSHRNTGF